MKKQHPSWKGIVPCFESGREYLDWIQNRNACAVPEVCDLINRDKVK